LAATAAQVVFIGSCIDKKYTHVSFLVFSQNHLVAVKKATIMWNDVDYIISEDVYT